MENSGNVAPPTGPMRSPGAMNGKMHKPAPWRMSPRMRATLLRAADVALFGCLLLYFAVLIFAAAASGRAGLALAVDAWLDAQWWKAPLALLLTGLAVFLVGKTIRTLMAVITPREDPAPEAAKGIGLLSDEHAELYALADEVSRKTRAPPPHAIRVGPRAECYGVEQRWFSFQPRRRLTLVIGLPHLAVMQLDDLRVVLAHEMIHFQHDTTMMVFLFRILHYWKAKLQAAARRPWLWAFPVLWFDWLCCESMLLFSTPLQRYRELLADIGSAHVFGGRLVRRTLVKEWILTHRFDDFLQSRWEELKDGVRPERQGGKIPDRESKMPAEKETTKFAELETRKLVTGKPAAEGAGQPPPPARGKGNVYLDFAAEWKDVTDAGNSYLLRRLAEVERGSIWDTHPTLGERIEAISGMRGVYETNDDLPGDAALGDAPARSIVPQFEEMAKAMEEILRYEATGQSSSSSSGIGVETSSEIAKR